MAASNDLEFAAAMNRHTTSLSGDNFQGFNNSLLEGHSYSSHVLSSTLQADSHASNHENFAVMYNITPQNEGSIQSINPLEEFASDTEHNSPPGRLLFLRGCPSSSKLTNLASKVRLDPDLVNRHMSHPLFTSGQRDLYCMPALPSATESVFQLNFPTLLSRERETSTRVPVDLRLLRRSAEEALNDYHRMFRSRSKLEDSVVRGYHILSRRHSAIEQLATVSIERLEQGWQVTVWLDVARDLGKSVAGPWCPPDRARAAWETFVYPVIQYEPDLIRFASAEAHVLNTVESSDTWTAGQAAGSVSFHYCDNLDNKIASEDALYCLGALFNLAASAGNQFLNFLRHQVKLEVSGPGSQNDYAFDNLQYLKKIADEHSRSLSETLATLDAASSAWPRAEEGSLARKESDKVARRLTRDFSHLAEKASDIAGMCSQNINALHSSSALQENKKAAESAESGRRLTLLATIYLPINFTCSLYGMNFVQFGTGSLNIWVWIVTTIPVVLISIFLYYANLGDILRKILRKFWINK